ncbi:uncharacterized protein LOC128118727 [Peromyscus californicus insignis]|uniref:uncharacterized protein LOC128118727 n=1 Tax=Peromyscus californicus insignis TaxID=564181 RepID=UPI0022A7BA8E|nr:uncharacterized protein LOC128118727 [Peromyscus californicus insignis]
MAIFRSSEPSDCCCSLSSLLAPDIPAVAPDIPAVAPDIPAVALDIPAVAPDIPAVAPDIPAVAPDIPAVAPDIPAVALDIPAVAPDIPAVAPDIPAVAPDIPSRSACLSLGQHCAAINSKVFSADTACTHDPLPNSSVRGSGCRVWGPGLSGRPLAATQPGRRLGACAAPPDAHPHRNAAPWERSLGGTTGGRTARGCVAVLRRIGVGSLAVSSQELVAGRRPDAGANAKPRSLAPSPAVRPAFSGTGRGRFHVTMVTRKLTLKATRPFSILARL